MRWERSLSEEVYFLITPECGCANRFTSHASIQELENDIEHKFACQVYPYCARDKQYLIDFAVTLYFDSLSEAKRNIEELFM